LGWVGGSSCLGVVPEALCYDLGLFGATARRQYVRECVCSTLQLASSVQVYGLVGLRVLL
jgi:hypothetical protein